MNNQEPNYKSVQKVIPVEFYMAAGMVDGNGKSANRILFKPVGGEDYYFLFPEKVEEAIRPAAKWLKDIMDRETGSGLVGEDIPEDLVNDGLVSNPLEG